MPLAGQNLEIFKPVVVAVTVDVVDHLTRLQRSPELLFSDQAVNTEGFALFSVPDSHVTLTCHNQKNALADADKKNTPRYSGGVKPFIRMAVES